MNTLRLNITLPKALVSRLGKKPNKSAFIAEAVREKLDEEEKIRGMQMLAEAYRQAAEEEAEEMRDWDALAGEEL